MGLHPLDMKVEATFNEDLNVKKLAFENVTPVNAVASEAILKVTTLPTAGETITIGDIVYTFVTNGTDPLLEGNIELEANVGDTRPNIVSAINGTDGHNILNPLVTAGAFAVANSTLTATVKGTSGDDIVTETTMVGADNEISNFDNGVDGTPAEANKVYFDGDYLYIATLANTVSGANWVRVQANTY